MTVTADPAAPPVAQWSAKVRQLHDHWRAIHPPTGLLPGRRHFDPLAVPRLMPLLWMADVQRSPLRFRYRLIGTAHVAAMGCDHTGRWIDEVFPGFADSRAYVQFANVVEGKRPGWRRGRPQYHVDPMIYETERLLLPMAANGRDVDLVLGITVYFRPGGTEIFR